MNDDRRRAPERAHKRCMHEQGDVMRELRDRYFVSLENPGESQIFQGAFIARHVKDGAFFRSLTYGQNATFIEFDMSKKKSKHKTVENWEPGWKDRRIVVESVF